MPRSKPAPKTWTATTHGSMSITTAPETFGDVVDALASAGLVPDHAEVTMVPSSYCDCDVDAAQKVLRLIDALEDLDDVQNVFSNASFRPTHWTVPANDARPRCRSGFTGDGLWPDRR